MNEYPPIEELEMKDTTSLIDLLAELTTQYTKLLISAPHSDEFVLTRNAILRIQLVLKKKTAAWEDEEEADGRA
jgi:hypothetical protein